MNLEHHPVPSELFRARSFEDSRREWLSHVQRAADLFSDEEILALSTDSAAQLVERLAVEPLVLLENEAYIEEHRSTRASVLVVPFTGDPDLFELDPRPLPSRSGTGYMPGPFGCVTEDALHIELTNTPGLSPGDHVSETRLAPVRTHVESLRTRLDASKPIYVLWDGGHSGPPPASRSRCAVRREDAGGLTAHSAST